jgi:hypothetical protein
MGAANAAKAAMCKGLRPQTFGFKQQYYPPILAIDF